eukprot:UC1_evm1s997
MGDVIISGHADAIKDGFGLEDVADAVFLDLPAPAKAVGAATRALKASGGRFCSFSPCIEQVQDTCQALQDAGYIDIVTLETLERQHVIKAGQSLTTPYFGRTDEEENEWQRKHASDPEHVRAAELVPAAVGEPAPPYKAVTLLARQRGHTGYLTFATKISAAARPPVAK